MTFSGLILCLNTTLNAQQNSDTTQKANNNNLPYTTICGANEGVIGKDTLMKTKNFICSEKNYEII